MLNKMCHTIGENVFLFKLALKAMLRRFSLSCTVRTCRLWGYKEFVPPLQLGYLFLFYIELDSWFQVYEGLAKCVLFLLACIGSAS